MLSHSEKQAIIAFHISTGAVEDVATASSDGLKWPLSLAVSDSDRTVYVANRGSDQIRAVTLPARYFITP